jgi:hypothetical protein
MKTRRTIRNCPLPVFRRVCPQQWDALAPTEQPSVRHCDHCSQNAYLCYSEEETLTRSRRDGEWSGIVIPCFFLNRQPIA